jgi:hypothetical protein
MEMTSGDLAELRSAKRILEHPSLAAKIINVVGSPIEKGFEMLPEKWAGLVSDAANKALATALDVALLTLNRDRWGPARNSWHKFAVAASGGTGGALGLAGLAIELPFSTGIMLRSIADIARAEGEQLNLPEAKLACIEVFALGGRTSRDDASEAGYFAVRAALARVVSEAAEFIAERGVAKEGAPVLARLIAQVSERFGVTVSEKAAAQAIPAIGAVGGALVNLVFIDHFQEMARGHFTVRRLERSYDPATVKAAYIAIEDD